MEAKKLNRLGFRFSEDINLISLLKENSSLAFDLPDHRKKKSEYSVNWYRNTTHPLT